MRSAHVRPLTGPLRLLPVAELTPGEFAHHERPLPEGSSLTNPAGWNRYWEESLADRGIRGLKPLRPGGWTVPVAQLTAPHVLGEVLRCHAEADLAGALAQQDVEGILPLAGGFALLADGNLVIEPGCCGDLGNIDSWQRAAAGDASGFWTGHPLVVATVEAGQLLLQEEPEEGRLDPERAWTLPLASLLPAIAEALEAQQALAARFVALLRERDADPAFSLALSNRLAGLCPPERALFPLSSIIEARTDSKA